LWIRNLLPIEISLFVLERKRAGVLSGDEDSADGEAGPLHDAVTKRLKREELEEAGKLKESVVENFSKEAAPDLVEPRFVSSITKSTFLAF